MELRAQLLAALTEEWTRLRKGETLAIINELDAMVSEGMVWRSYELVVRYCLPHDTSEMIIENDHAAEKVKIQSRV